MVFFGPDQLAVSFDLSEKVVVAVGRMRHPALVVTVPGLKSTAKDRQVISL